jgi:hypothetical protein
MKNWRFRKKECSTRLERVVFKSMVFEFGKEARDETKRVRTDGREGKGPALPSAIKAEQITAARKLLLLRWKVRP